MKLCLSNSLELENALVKDWVDRHTLGCLSVVHSDQTQSNDFRAKLMRVQRFKQN